MLLTHSDGKAPIKLRKHDRQNGGPENRFVERPKDPREGQRYRDDEQQKDVVFQGAHAVDRDLSAAS